MSGQWPPEWEDPDDERSDAGPSDQRHSDAGHSDLELSGVTSFLASVHSPALPASFEARISAAIAAEAAARAGTEPGAAAEAAGPLTAAAGADDAKDTVRSANPEEFSPAATAGGPSTPAGRRPRRGTRASRSAARASGPGGSRPGTGRRRLRMPSMQAASWTLVCVLIVAGFGFLVTHGSGSSSSSSVDSSGTSQSASAAAGGNESQPAAGPISPEHAASAPEDGRPTRFLVYSTGTAYERSTLASQVRDQLGSLGSINSAVTPASSASASAAASSAASSSSAGVGASVPSARLSGCVSAVTGRVAPSLVDKASYDGIPAYIIAVPTEVWVVGRGCTAADTQLLTRVPLKG
jgi:trimeric autotransporter adhesin